MIRMVSWNIARRFPAQEHRLPTGGGKTVIGGVLLAYWLADNRKAVWLTHRKELAEQTRGMLTDAGVSARTNIRWPPGNRRPGHGRWGRHSHGSDRGSADRQTPGVEPLQSERPDGDRRSSPRYRRWLGAGHGAVVRPHRRHDRDPVAQVGKEGFDHLFHELLCGPQTADLQAHDPPFLCSARSIVACRGGSVSRVAPLITASAITPKLA